MVLIAVHAMLAQVYIERLSAYLAQHRLLPRLLECGDMVGHQPVYNSLTLPLVDVGTAALTVLKVFHCYCLDLKPRNRLAVSAVWRSRAEHDVGPGGR